MENVVKEDVLQALNEFEVRNDIPIPSLLEEYLHFVASTGDTVFPWTIIKVLVRRKIEQVRTLSSVGANGVELSPDRGVILVRVRICSQKIDLISKSKVSGSDAYPFEVLSLRTAMLGKLRDSKHRTPGDGSYTRSSFLGVV